MRQRLVDFFRKDSTLKVISAISAILIWFFVLSDGNPKVDRTMYLNYQIEQSSISGNVEGTSIKNVDKISIPISVKVTGRSQSVYNTTENDLNVELDFSGVTRPGSISVPIKVRTNKVGIKIDSYSPKEISMRFEKIIDKSFKVGVEINKNVLKPGYEVVKTTVIPESIPIRGFETMVNRVASVKVSILPGDVETQIGKAVTVRKICKYYDKNNKEITDLEKNEFVDVQIEVGKKVNLQFNVKGTPASGYYVDGNAINPLSVLITGEPGVLDKINSLSTSAVDINGASANVKKSVNINLPEGVALANTTSRADVTINITQYEVKDINIKNTDINLKGAKAELYNYVITDGTFTFSFKGKKEDVQDIDVSVLKPEINVENLQEGNYDLDISIVSPAAVEITGSGRASVNITRKPATQSPQASTPGTATPTPGDTAQPGDTAGPTATADIT